MAFRLTLTGVGAMNSPRFAPAGLLAAYDGASVMLDGGERSASPERLTAWLVTDEKAELIRQLKDPGSRSRHGRGDEVSHHRWSLRTGTTRGAHDT